MPQQSPKVRIMKIGNSIKYEYDVYIFAQEFAIFFNF